MSESAVESALVRRIEKVARENENLKGELGRLRPAIGHTALLVELAGAVRQWRSDGSDEAKAKMFALVDEYDRSRNWSSEGRLKPKR